MKRKLLIVSVLAILVAVTAAGTLAYFTDTGTAHNVITTGNVKIELKEWADEACEEPFKDKTGVMPGTKVTKIVEVKNTGTGAAFVRPARGEECLRRESEADEIRSRQPGLRQ